MTLNLSLAIGIIFLAGSLGGVLARKIKLPSVTGYLFAGLLIGPSILGLINKEIMNQLAPINDLALGVIAVSIGAELHWKTMRKLAKDASKVFVIEAIFTFTFVFTLLYLFDMSFKYALLFGVISIATAPGAIIACVRESRSKGEFSRVLLSVVALDNIFAITAFGVILSFLQVNATMTDGGNIPAILMASKDLGLSILLGTASGLFLVYISYTVKNDARILVSVLTAILLTVGLATLIDIPALLANITAGMVFINFAKRPKRIRFSLMGIEYPILLLFLTLAGAKLDLTILPSIGLIGFVYISARFLGKLVGSRVGSSFTDFPISWKRNLGRALTPQAGVAIGLSIIAEQK